MLCRTGIGLDVRARSIAATAFIPETGEIVQKAFPYDAGNGLHPGDRGDSPEGLPV